MSEENGLEKESETTVTLRESIECRYPSPDTLLYTMKLSITEDKPLMFDYWVDSCEGGALIGIRDNGEKLLVKSEDEYTSPIDTIYNAGTEYIIVTENSIYLVSSDISSNSIS